jgi:hypothetical protein
MHDHALRDALSTIATEAVPETTDLWPAISRRLGGRARPARRRLDRRRLGLIAGAALVVVVGLTLVRPSLPGQLTTAQAADIARNDPEVAAILRGDIAIVTVTTVVNDVATVVVRDSHGREVTVAVDLRSRVATIVYQGPQLSAALTAEALAVVRADPRTSALLARGATFGRIMPITVAYQVVPPAVGQPTQGTATWAQVTLEIGGDEWVAYVDLPMDRIDQLVDPQGNQVPLP